MIFLSNYCLVSLLHTFSHHGDLCSFGIDFSRLMARSGRQTHTSPAGRCDAMQWLCTSTGYYDFDSGSFIGKKRSRTRRPVRTDLSHVISEASLREEKPHRAALNRPSAMMCSRADERGGEGQSFLRRICAQSDRVWAPCNGHASLLSYIL